MECKDEHCAEKAGNDKIRCCWSFRSRWQCCSLKRAHRTSKVTWSSARITCDPEWAKRIWNALWTGRNPLRISGAALCPHVYAGMDPWEQSQLNLKVEKQHCESLDPTLFNPDPSYKTIGYIFLRAVEVIVPWTDANASLLSLKTVDWSWLRQTNFKEAHRLQINTTITENWKQTLPLTLNFPSLILFRKVQEETFSFILKCFTTASLGATTWIVFQSIAYRMIAVTHSLTLSRPSWVGRPIRRRDPARRPRPFRTSAGRLWTCRGRPSRRLSSAMIGHNYRLIFIYAIT